MTEPFDLYLDVPRAIPAADPFNPMPEPVWVSEAVQNLRDELGGQDVMPDEIDRQVTALALELGAEDHRDLTVAPALVVIDDDGRFHDPATGQFISRGAE